ncbi:MAG TPA: hypothetical protein P5052_00550 [Candidatus Paceibacterota bacterium]|nr:hypothetical protein [Candidatus Paceibacterota bacterium]HRZ29291.1 hypothetical protein [Candidatus Paceibacterota bacterium]
MIITKIGSSEELSQKVIGLICELKIRNTASMDHNGWVFVVGKFSCCNRGKSITRYHIVARSKITYQTIEKLVESLVAIKNFITAVITNKVNNK